ncbi:MAG: hypothetical protein CMB82_00860 [Flammeovirgaceae bacterium]|nr:hypothetical protein [Flammeovirgaceae bacterium]
MYKCYFGLLLCFFQHLIIAQQSDSLTQFKTNNFIQYLEDKDIGWTTFAGFDMAPTMGNFQKQIRIDIALTLKKLSLGMTYLSLFEVLEQYVIFPNIYRLNAKHGGIILGISIFQSKWINGYLNTAYHWGQMSWEDPLAKEHVFSSKSECIKPEFEIIIYPKFGLQLSIKVGYQQMIELDLPRINSADFSGLFYSLGLKINLSNEKY